MNNNFLVYRKRKIMSLLGICICMLMIIVLCPDYNKRYENKSKVNTNIQNTYLSNSEAEASDEYIYLSDIPYVKGQSRTGWGSIHINETDNGGNFSIKIEGAFYSFEKGIWAHASSVVVYDITNYQNYDYFTTYTAVNSTSGDKGNGVKFYIYTSEDGKNWDLKTDSNPSAVKSSNNANFVKISIKDVKFLKLVANDNNANGNDHSVYVDAKLIKETYKEPGEDLVPSTSELDKKIKKEYANASLSNSEYELTLLKREFINKVGNYALKRFLSESEINKQTYTWLTSDVNNLRLYVLGGTPEGGSYYNSLNVLSKLYEEYSSDFENSERLNNKWYLDMTYGYLYKKMAFSIALTHSKSIGLWMQSGNEVNKSDPLRRYAIFKYLHKNGKFKATNKLDITPWFESLQVEEMRLVMNNAIDDESILWLNEYVQSYLDKSQNANYLTPHSYVAYVWPNYTNPIYYDEANKDYFNELFAVNGTGLFDLKYTVPGGKNIKSYDLSVTRGTSDNKIQKVWMNFRNKFGTGAVCGGISKSGSNIRTTHGIPAVVIGQPGHAAILYYTKNEQGKGYWGIDNDVSGWPLSEKGERMLNGWGNASYSKGYSVVYMVLAQEALNDYENYEKSQETVMLANIYKGNSSKQEEIYRKALKIQSINIDAWYGLINLYLSDETKTEKDYYNLADEVAQSLKDFPLPMYHLTNLIKPKLTSVEYSFKFTLLQTRILTEGSNSASTKVLQPGVTKTEAKYLLGKLDTSLASFSFDGDNAGKIVLSSRFDGSGVRLDYSLDGKKSWNEVSFSAEEEHKITLTNKQIESITDGNDIYVHIVGTSYDENNLFKIDIKKQSAPSNLYNNDLENKVIGATETMEWRMDGSSKWTSFKDSEPDLTGDKTVFVRTSKTGAYLESDEVSLSYTIDPINEKKKYISISNLSIHEVSSEATAQDRHAKYAIDGNKNTLWHSAWDGSDTNKYIVIKIDKPVYLSALDYMPSAGGNGRVQNAQILVSMDAENWTEVISDTSWANNSTIKTVDFDESIRAKYVKIVGKVTSTVSSGKSYMTATMINLYEDTTKQVLPTADIEYDIKSLTNKDVTAKLVNPSTGITIKNNNGKDSYIFKENGKFTFEFVDEAGNVGSAVAIVSNIDKILPTATIKYSNEEETNESVIATLTNESEPITILNNDGKKEYTFTKNGTFEFTYKDNAGNVNKTTAKVNWIISNSDEEEIENPDKKPEEENPNKDVDSNENPDASDSANTSESSNQKPNTNDSENISESTTPNVNTNSNTNEVSTSSQTVKNTTIKEQPIEIEYKTYTVLGVTLQIPSNVITEKVELKSNKLKLSKELQKKINGDNEYFEIYFENEKEEKISIDSVSMKMTIKVDSNKKLSKIYEILEDDTLRELSYNKLSDDEIELEINSLEKYVISYEKEDITIEPEYKENKNINFMLVGSVIISILILITILRKHIKK